MRKAVFLDRDGVINRKPPEHDYVKRWEELELLPTVAAAIKKLKDAGYFVIVISNQRGVARNIMRIEDVNDIHRRLNLKMDGLIDGFYCCFHDHQDNCECRKPKPGLVHQAVAEWEIDSESSWMVGDSEADVECGQAAGVKTIRMETDASLLEVVESLFMG